MPDWLLYHANPGGLVIAIAGLSIFAIIFITVLGLAVYEIKTKKRSTWL